MLLRTQLLRRFPSSSFSSSFSSSASPFELSADAKLLQAAARKFAQAELPALAAQLEATNAPVPREWCRRFGAEGFLGVNTPTEYGGLGLGHTEALVVLEQFCQVSSAVAFPLFEALVGPIKAVEKFGSEPLKRRLLPAVCAGERQVAIAISEPDAGSAATDMMTRAEYAAAGGGGSGGGGDGDGDGSLLLNGSKRWCSGAGHSDMVVFCRMPPPRGAAAADDAASSPQGAGALGAVFVACDAPGVTFGAPETLAGFRGVPSADIFLDGVGVPAEDVLLERGSFGLMMQAFCLERCGNATMSLANAQASLDDAAAHVQQREQFGRPLVEFQAVQMKLAECKMRVDAARLLIMRAVAAADAEALSSRGAGAGGAADAGAEPRALCFPSTLDSSLAKCFSNENAVEVCSVAMQLFGGYGFSTSLPLERRMRDVLGWRIAGGAIDIQKTNIASAMVGRRFNQRK